jgi:hypothetical protein
MKIPLWVRDYWVEILWPALSAEDLNEDLVKRVFAQTLQDWGQHSTKRGALADATIGRYLTDTRNWIRDLPSLEILPPGCRAFSVQEAEFVLVDYNQPTEWWTALTSRSQSRVDDCPN